MKEGWELKTLKEVCEIKPPKKEAREKLGEKDQVTFLPMNMLGIDQKYCEGTEKKKLKEVAGSYTYFRENDVLLAKITPCFENGKLGIAKNLENEIGFGSSEFVVYRPSKKIDNEYLYYFFYQPSFRETGSIRMTGAVGHKRIPKDFYEDHLIPVPPIYEQKQIVKILDEAFAAIDQIRANIEKNIENAKELFQSKLNEIFFQKGASWEEIKLSEVCEVKDGTHDSPKYVGEENGIPFITQKNILETGLTFENIKFISQEDHEDFYRRSNVALNDILIAMIGANRGMACLVDDDRIFSIKNVGLIKANEKVRPEFLLFYLRSPKAKKYVAENSSGSAQGFIGLGKLRAFPVPIPDLYTQDAIVNKLESFEGSLHALSENFKKRISHLEELKRSILQKAFAGELTQKEIEV